MAAPPFPPQPPFEMPPARTLLVPGHGELFLRDSRGDGPPVMLLHGWMASADLNWCGAYGALIDAGYRVLAIDHRGHGRGLRPLVRFRLTDCAADAAAALRTLGLAPALVVGYSMGGAIGWGLAKYYPERVTSLIIGGYWAQDLDPSLAKDPEEQEYRRTLRKGKDAVTKAFIKDLKKEKKTLQKPAVLNRLRPYRLRAAAEQDPKAVLAFDATLFKERLHMVDLLPRLTIPCLLFAGEKDMIFEGAKKACALLRHGRFISFPGLGHMETWARLDLALPPVLKFVNDVDRGVLIK